MEFYDVTVWDSSGGDKPDDWLLESPPVRVGAMDSYEAAREVAGRAGIRLPSSSGIRRPYGEIGSGMFFRAPKEELVFQVEGTSPSERKVERRVFGSNKEGGDVE